MMGGKAARNMYSRNTNKFVIQCVYWFYSQGYNQIYVLQRTDTETKI